MKIKKTLKDESKISKFEVALLKKSLTKTAIIALIGILSVGLLVPLVVQANSISYSDIASIELPTLRSCC